MSDCILSSSTCEKIRTLALNAGGKCGAKNADEASATKLRLWGAPFSVLQGVRESCLLVGHEPDLSGLAATLLGIPPQTLRLRKAGLLHLRAPFALAWQPGTAQLEALLRPGLMVPKG